MKRCRVVHALAPPLLLCLLAGMVLAADVPAVPRSVIGSGGGTAAGGNVAVSSALGQGVAGPSQGGNVALCSGFWCGGLHFFSFLPLALCDYTWCDPYEPNDSRYTNPWGPVAAGQAIVAKMCIGDAEDNYFFSTNTVAPVQMRLILGQALRTHAAIWLYARSDLAQPIPNCGGQQMDADHTWICSIPHSGEYIVRIYAVPDDFGDDEHSYTLTVIFQ